MSHPGLVAALAGSADVGGPEGRADDLAVIVEDVLPAHRLLGRRPGRARTGAAGQILDAAVSVTAHPPGSATLPMPR
jgi:hypothetical protein